MALKYAHDYEVIVGNIGTVYMGRNKKIANDTFDTYVKSSVAGVGRAAYEDVTMLLGGEIEREHSGEPEQHTFECLDCEAEYVTSLELGDSSYCPGCERERYNEGNTSFFEP